MHFHLPKPLHGWRQFMGEVGIIVLGVLIALGAEQLVGIVHQRSEAEQAKDDVKLEIAKNLASMVQRQKTEECVQRRLNAIGLYLAALNRGERPAQPKWIGRPQVWTMSTTRWTAATSTEGLLTPDEHSTFSNIYVDMNEFVLEEHEEQLAWAELRAMTYLANVNRFQQADFVRALQVGRFTDWRISLEIDQSIENARDLGITPAANARPGSRSACLPISMDPSAARRMASLPFREPD
jgi:hypothetical protein